MIDMNLKKCPVCGKEYHWSQTMDGFVFVDGVGVREKSIYEENELEIRVVSCECGMSLGFWHVHPDCVRLFAMTDHNI